MQAILPPKPIQVKSGSTSASASAAAAAAPAAVSGSGQYPPATPLQTPPYSALRTPRTPALLDAFGKGDSTITHFAPADSKGVADHTLKTLGLAFNLFETYLSCKFPYKALQTVSCSTLKLFHVRPVLKVSFRLAALSSFFRFGLKMLSKILHILLGAPHASCWHDLHEALTSFQHQCFAISGLVSFVRSSERKLVACTISC